MPMLDAYIPEDARSSAGNRRRRSMDAGHPDSSSVSVVMSRSEARRTGSLEAAMSPVAMGTVASITLYAAMPGYFPHAEPLVEGSGAVVDGAR